MVATAGSIPGTRLNRDAFYDAIRPSSLFRSLNQGQVDGINGLLDFWESNGTGIDRQLGYILATAYHETARQMSPVRETLATSDAEARRKLKRRKYGKPAGPYGHVYYGRGQVQLTWHSNYVDSSADAGVDLEQFPDKMLDPEISARITILGMLDGRFNGSKGHAGNGLGEYLTDTKARYKDARRTVNITDKWSTIRDYSRAFERAIATARAAGNWTETKPTKDKGARKPMLSGLIGAIAGPLLAEIFPTGKSGNPISNVFRTILGFFTADAAGDNLGIFDWIGRIIPSLGEIMPNLGGAGGIGDALTGGNNMWLVLILLLVQPLIEQLSKKSAPAPETGKGNSDTGTSR